MRPKRILEPRVGRYPLADRNLDRVVTAMGIIGII